MENTDEKRIIEINGIKMEVDLRHARRVDCYRVGDSVKVLVKQYSDTYTTYPGVIIGFTEFQNRPCIDLVYVSRDGDVVFKSYTQDDKDTEIAPFNEYEQLFEKVDIVEKLDRKIVKAEEELRMLKEKKAVFLKFFNATEQAVL